MNRVRASGSVEAVWDSERMGVEQSSEVREGRGEGCSRGVMAREIQKDSN